MRGLAARTERHHRVAVAMSGGLDSAMALVLLREAGRQAVGVTMRLWPAQGSDSDDDTSDIVSAQQVCAHYGAEHLLLDLRDQFCENVVADFVSEYASARTPNPCVRCNATIKFGALLDAVRERGFDSLATGHYVRSVQQDGRFRLLRGVDAAKDQSYFLYMLSQQQLAQLLFPLGSFHKDEVRSMARARGMRVTERPESQDVCFLRGEPYSRLLMRMAPDAFRSGPMLNRAGERLGTHRGLPRYTVGQRSGLGLSSSRPLYVVALDAPHNALIVGHSEDLDCRALVAECMRFVSGSPPAAGTRLQAQVRYRARPVAATLEPLDGRRARVVLDRVSRGVAPGQAVVFYAGDEVVGGGRIAAALPDDPIQER